MDTPVVTVREFGPWGRLPAEAEMRRAVIGFALFLIGAALPVAETSYYPPPGEWARKERRRKSAWTPRS